MFYHQVPQSGLKNSTHIDPYISAVEHDLSRDWEARVIELADGMVLQSKNQEYAMRSMVRILACEEAYALPEKSDCL